MEQKKKLISLWNDLAVNPKRIKNENGFFLGVPGNGRKIYPANTLDYDTHDIKEKETIIP